MSSGASSEVRGILDISLSSGSFSKAEAVTSVTVSSDLTSQTVGIVCVKESSGAFSKAAEAKGVADISGASSEVAMETTAAATAATGAATPAKIGTMSSFTLSVAAESAGWVFLGPRFTGIGVLLPTAFFGLLVLVLDLFKVLGLALTSFEGAALLSLSLLEVLTSAALLEVVSFLDADSGLAGVADFGVSGLVVFVAVGRVSGEAAGFLATEVGGCLLTSFLTGVVVLGVGVRAARGAVVLAGEGLAVVGAVLGVAVVDLDADVVLLGVAGFGVAAEDRAAGVVPTGLVALETGGLSGLGEPVTLGLVVDAEAGLGAGTVVFCLGFRPSADAAGAFLMGCVVFSPLVEALAGFFSATFVWVLVLVAAVDPTGFLGAVEDKEVFFSTPTVVVFLVTPLACGFCVPFVKRPCPVVGRELAVDGLVPAADVFVLAGAFVLVLASEGFSFPVLLFVASVGCGWPSVCVAGEAWS